jgi:hypothetical protein
MASKRKILRKIQLGILPPNAVYDAISGGTPIEETATVTPATVDVETVVEAFQTANPILSEEEKPAKKTRTRKSTARKKTTKTKKNS